MSDAVFGPVVTATDVENSVINTLKEWMPTYLAFMTRRRGLPPGAYPNIESWRAADTMDERFAEQLIPAVQVMLTTDDQIYTQPEGALIHFNGTVDVLVSSTEPEAARENAATYAFAIGLCLVQQKALDGTLRVEGLGWERTGVPAVGRPDERWLALGSSEVFVVVGNAFRQEQGPAVPTEGVPPDRDHVESHEVILEPEGV